MQHFVGAGWQHLRPNKFSLGNRNFGNRIPVKKQRRSWLQQVGAGAQHLTAGVAQELLRKKRPALACDAIIAIAMAVEARIVRRMVFSLENRVVRLG